jgi:hypothetical protein
VSDLSPSLLFALVGFTTEFFHRELWRAVDYASLDDFLSGFLENYFLPMDPNNLLCMIWKAQANDVSRLTGILTACWAHSLSPWLGPRMNATANLRDAASGKLVASARRGWKSREDRNHAKRMRAWSVWLT